MSWLLIGVVAIILLNALIGMKVGFIKTVFSMFSLLVAMVLTTWISPLVSNALASNAKVNSMVNNRIEKVLPVAKENIEPRDEKSYINEMSLPDSIKETLIKNLDDKKEDLNKYIISSMTSIVIKALGFIITFIVILVLLWVACIALNIISHLPILKQINKAAGLLAGLLHGLIIVWLLLILLTVFGGTKFGMDAFKSIEESQILSLIYDNNLLLNIVTSAIKTKQ